MYLSTKNLPSAIAFPRLQLRRQPIAAGVALEPAKAEDRAGQSVSPPYHIPKDSTQ
jgi:hypothetical protein